MLRGNGWPYDLIEIDSDPFSIRNFFRIPGIENLLESSKLHRLWPSRAKKEQQEHQQKSCIHMRRYLSKSRDWVEWRLSRINRPYIGRKYLQKGDKFISPKSDVHFNKLLNNLIYSLQFCWTKTLVKHLSYPVHMLRFTHPDISTKQARSRGFV